MVKELDRAEKHSAKVFEWAGAVNDNLRDSIKHLEKLKADPTHEHYKNAYRELRSGRRANYKMHKYYRRVKNNLGKLKDMLPPKLKNELDTILSRWARPHEAALIAKSSLFAVGGKGLNKDIKKLGISQKLVEKGKMDPRIFKRAVDVMINKIKMVLADPRLGTGNKPGLIPFITVVNRKIQPFVAKLQKQAA